MPPNLRRLAKVVDRLAAGFAELQSCIAVMIEAEAAPKTEVSEKSGQLKKPRPRWTGPVSAEVHAERVALYYRRFTLAMNLGLDATGKTFCARHKLDHPSELSRWLSLQARGIAPGSAVDINIRRALAEDTLKFEALLAKRLGASRIANSSARFSHSISA